MSDAPRPHVMDLDRLAAVADTKLLDTLPEAAFDELAALAARLLDAPHAFVTLVDAERSYWKSRIGIPLDGPVQNRVEESFCQYVIASGEPLIAGDVTTNPLIAGNPSIASMGVRAWAGFPLLSSEGLALGSFCVVDTVTRSWSETDVEVLRVLSAAASRELALRSTVARATIDRGRLSLLSEVAQALAETLDPQEAVARLAKVVIPTLGDWSIVSLVQPDGALADVSWWHARPELGDVMEVFGHERLVGLAGRGATIEALRSRRPAIVNSGALEAGLDVLVSEAARAAYVELDPASYGVWPLTYGNTIHGVLVIGRDRGHLPFAADETELASAIADRAGAILDNAALYARLQATARHHAVVAHALQEAMLPQLPKLGSGQITARYLTADAADQVGGDWYDALVSADEGITLVIGDVAGHNILAASVMGQLRNLLRAFLWQRADDPPSALLAQLNNAMPDLGVTTLTTAIVARIEPPSRSNSANGADDSGDSHRAAGGRVLRWSSAGHPVPILIDVDGTAELLSAPADPPLGTVTANARRDHVTVIRPGQTLLFYTDGLIETRADDLDTRQAQLLDVLREHGAKELDDLLDITVEVMVGRERLDDVALLALRLGPPDDSVSSG